MTTTYRIEVWTKDAPRRQADGVTYVGARLYFLQGDLTVGDVRAICSAILVDPVVDDYALDAIYQPDGVHHTIDVTFLPGVTDSAAESLLHAVRILGIDGLDRAATGERYLIYDANADLDWLATRVFANPLIQRYHIDAPITPPFVDVQTANDTVELISLKDADDDRLANISRERRLSLDLHEMRAIRDYFQEMDREPTDAELEMLAQTWSEHCVHKTFKAKIAYVGPEAGENPLSTITMQSINGILNTYIRAATEQVNKDWVRSAFVDNAGIVRFDDTWDIAFKAETHNRPSALEPFGGANTGMGGVIRDVLGVSARPIANTDILFFGQPDIRPDDVPDNVLHPNRIAEGVIAGIEDYGNKMGIPTVNGGIFYHEGYVSNPLVFCGCVGILPHGSHRTGAKAGDLIVVIGGRTGRDGLRGATFSSMEMDTTTSELSGGAVQIGHPIHEKQVLEVVLRARDEGLYNAITDCGAGGLSSAVGEMGEKVGAAVQLAHVPLKYPGLRPWEIWLSEAQERMVLAVPPEKWERLAAICAGQDVEAVAIGTFEPTGRLTLHYDEKPVGDISMAFLHDGIPQRHMTAEWQAPKFSNDVTFDRKANADALLSLLAMPNIRSKEDVIRRYDHEIMGGTAVKPLVGVQNDGPSDAAVIVPQNTGIVPQNTGMGESGQAFALSVGFCPQYTEYDPYCMAWAAIDEAMRNLVAVGADPSQVSILDNFSWGNTNMPDRLGELVRCAQGCYDAATAYDVPFVSGKDSLNNEYLDGDGKRRAIPGTLVISALGIVPDVTKTVTMDFKETGNAIYVIGETADELGGSHYHLLHGVSGGHVPKPKRDSLHVLQKLHGAIQAGLVQACHDVSEGGLAVALAEMCIAGRRGAAVKVGSLADDVVIALFSESLTRFIVEVTESDRATFEAAMADVPCTKIGQVDGAQKLTVADADCEIELTTLEQAWRGHIDEQGETPPAPQFASVAQIPSRQPTKLNQSPRVMILHANGTNRDRDAAIACELAGGVPEIVHVNQLIDGERRLRDYHMLVVPGGFSYGDDLGAGVLWALDLRERFGDDLQRFIADERPVLGICNGFQALVKAGVLPGADWSADGREVTLTHNAKGRFECRWVYLEANPACPSIFTQGLDDRLYVPVAHGEGRVMAKDEATLKRLWDDGLIGLRYVDAHGQPAGYPLNPNGSVLDIAGLSNPAGNVFGLMPHPENHVFAWQHPRYHRGERGLSGLRLFENGVRFA